MGGVATARLAFGFVALCFATFRVVALGFAVRRMGFLTDFFGLTARRRAIAFLPPAFALTRVLRAAFALTGRVFRCLGLDRLFFPDFLAMLPPVRSD